MSIYTVWSQVCNDNYNIYPTVKRKNTERTYTKS